MCQFTLFLDTRTLKNVKAHFFLIENQLIHLYHNTPLSILSMIGEWRLI